MFGRLLVLVPFLTACSAPVARRCARDQDCASDAFCDQGICHERMANGFDGGSTDAGAGCAHDSDCPQPGSCDPGSHTCACAAGTHLCGASCADNSSPQSCGQDCSPCARPNSSTATCTAGTCGFDCNSGFHLCGQQCADDTSPSSCGTSCSPCTAPNDATATCAVGACGFVCNPGFHLCGSQCLDDTSPASCGTLCTPCTPPTNADAACSQGNCGFRCHPGFFHCSTGCCGAIVVSAGWTHTCAALVDGTVKCWGGNGDGTVGDGTLVDRPAPTLVAGVAGATFVGAGAHDSCAATSNGLFCWGANAHGEFGDGTTNQSSTPVLASLGGKTPLMVALGEYHAGILYQTPPPIVSGIAVCGANQAGQLGNGTTTDSATFMTDAGLRSITTGASFTCAAVSGGAKCFGSNQYGQLGDGTTQDRTTPVSVIGLTAMPHGLAAGDLHVCAAMPDGTVDCWGANADGQLGVGDSTDRSTPTWVSGLGSPSITMVAAGGAHSCSLDANGAVQCWGSNLAGQLGTGTTTSSNVPVQVFGLNSGVAFVGCGYAHTCAVLTNGAVECWGDNSYGQLGDGSNASQLIPAAVTDP